MNCNPTPRPLWKEVTAAIKTALKTEQPALTPQDVQRGMELNEQAEYFLYEAIHGDQTKRAENFSKAWEYFEAAYELKDPEATHNLACLYKEGWDRNGRFGKTDTKKAAQYFKEAAKLGDPNAMETLQHGYSVVNNVEKAQYYQDMYDDHARAHEAQAEPAPCDDDKLVVAGAHVDAPAPIKPAIAALPSSSEQPSTAIWKSAAPKVNSADRVFDAQAKAGMEHTRRGKVFLQQAYQFSKEDAARNFANAWENFEQGYKLKNPEATFFLGYFYRYGISPTGAQVEKDFVKAAQYFKEAADLGFPDAKAVLQDPRLQQLLQKQDISKQNARDNV